MCLNGYCLFLSLTALIGLSVFVSRINQDLINLRKQVWSAKSQGSNAFTCLQLCSPNQPYQQLNHMCCLVSQFQDNCRMKTQCFVQYIAVKQKQMSSIAVTDQYAIGLQTIMFFVFLMNTYGVCYKYKRRDNTAIIQDQRRNAIMASILIEVQQYVQQDGNKRILTQSFVSEQVEQMCAVCLQCYGEEKVIKLNCSHVFHRGCIQQWISKHTTCPVCRASL